VAVDNEDEDIGGVADDVGVTGAEGVLDSAGVAVSDGVVEGVLVGVGGNV
jgi:hypothetical protein